MFPYLVFAQQPDLVPDEFALVRQARTYFRAELTFPRRQFGGVGAAAWGRLAMTLAFPKDPSPIFIEARLRWATPVDYALADEAERRGNATGMAGLARRCPVLWELDPAGQETSALLRLCAVLASVLLGPVLPPDRSTLFGVRGARERAEKAAGSRGAIRRLR